MFTFQDKKNYKRLVTQINTIFDAKKQNTLLN